MQPLAELCERIAATTKKTEKIALLAEYFRSRDLRDAAISARIPLRTRLSRI